MYEDSDEGEDRVLDPDYKQPNESDSTEGTNPFTNSLTTKDVFSFFNQLFSVYRYRWL